MRAKKRNSFAPRVGVTSENQKNILITKLEKRISGIINELTEVQKERDEEAMIRMSNLTQERDRLIERLEELKHTKTFGSFMKQNNSNSIKIGDRVKLRIGKRDLELSLVGDYEADSTSGAISTLSPLGKTLMEKSEGDSFSIDTPAGSINYEVLSVN